MHLQFQPSTLRTSLAIHKTLTLNYQQRHLTICFTIDRDHFFVGKYSLFITKTLLSTSGYLLSAVLTNSKYTSTAANKQTIDRYTSTAANKQTIDTRLQLQTIDKYNSQQHIRNISRINYLSSLNNITICACF